MLSIFNDNGLHRFAKTYLEQAGHRQDKDMACVVINTCCLSSIFTTLIANKKESMRTI
mgnify:FL=1